MFEFRAETPSAGQAVKCCYFVAAAAIALIRSLTEGQVGRNLELPGRVKVYRESGYGVMASRITIGDCL